jgi:hypothetical protein
MELQIKQRARMSRRMQRGLGAVGLAAGLFLGLSPNTRDSSAEVRIPGVVTVLAASTAVTERKKARRTVDGLVATYRRDRLGLQDDGTMSPLRTTVKNAETASCDYKLLPKRPFEKLQSALMPVMMAASGYSFIYGFDSHHPITKSRPEFSTTPVGIAAFGAGVLLEAFNTERFTDTLEHSGVVRLEAIDRRFAKAA